MFPRWVRSGEAPGEKAVGSLQTVQTQRGFGTLMEHDANLCEGRPTSEVNLVHNRFPKWRYRVASSDPVFSGTIAAIYDRFMVPLVFQPYAELVAGRAAQLEPRRILETAAGTGVVTEAMQRALPEAEIVAIDLNQPMLDQADAFDLAVCQFGVMFYPDKVRGNTEARRVLREGHYLLVVWDHIERNLATMLAGQAVADLIRGEAGRFYERVPFRYHDPDAIERDLRAAGFEQIAIETIQLRSKAGSPRDAAIALVQGTPMRADIEEVAPGQLEAATDAAEAALQQFQGPDGFDAPMSAHLVTATK
jgi:ubiquinone/menaquinone biosynthesis C-methylase UbiE